MRRWSAGKKWAVFTGVPMAILMLAVLLTLALGQRAVAAALAEAHEAGLLTSYAEVGRLAAAKDQAKNSAPLWDAGRAVTHTLYSGGKPQMALDKGEPFPNENQYLKDLEGALIEFRQAAQLPYYDMNRNWGLGYRLLFPDLASGKESAKVLMVGAQLRARRGEFAKAKECLDLATAQAKAIGQEPTLLAQLVAVAEASIVTSFAAKIGAGQPSRPEAIQLAKDILSDDARVFDFKRGLMTEVPFSATSMGDLLRDSPDLALKDKVLLRTPPVVDAVRARGITSVTRLYRVVLKDPNDWRTIRKACVDLDREQRGGGGFINEYASMLLPAFEQLADVQIRAQVMRRCALVMIYAVEYRQKHGAYPQSLNLLPLDSTDPISGKPLLWKADAAGAMIYSVGPDGVDDGGSRMDNKDWGVSVGAKGFHMNLSRE